MFPKQITENRGLDCLVTNRQAMMSQTDSIKLFQVVAMIPCLLAVWRGKGDGRDPVLPTGIYIDIRYPLIFLSQ